MLISQIFFKLFSNGPRRRNLPDVNQRLPGVVRAGWSPPTRVSFSRRGHQWLRLPRINVPQDQILGQVGRVHTSGYSSPGAAPVRRGLHLESSQVCRTQRDNRETLDGAGKSLSMIHSRGSSRQLLRTYHIKKSMH